MVIEEIVNVASRMYGISSFKSRKLVEEILNSNGNLEDSEILRLVGKKVLFSVVK